MGLALLPAAFFFLPLFEIKKQKRLKKNERFEFLPLFEIRKQKRLKENDRSEFSLASLTANSLSGSA